MGLATLTRTTTEEKMPMVVEEQVLSNNESSESSEDDLTVRDSCSGRVSPRSYVDFLGDEDDPRSPAHLLRAASTSRKTAMPHNGEADLRARVARFTLV